MPRVDIWIRKEDEAKWNAIKDRPEWLHHMLNDSYHGLPIKDMPESFEPIEPLQPAINKRAKETWQGSNFKKNKK